MDFPKKNVSSHATIMTIEQDPELRKYQTPQQTATRKMHLTLPFKIQCHFLRILDHKSLTELRTDLKQLQRYRQQIIRSTSSW